MSSVSQTRSIRIGSGSADSDAGREAASSARGVPRLLRLRVITALIAAPLVIGALFFLPSIAFAVVFLALAGVGLYEWANLAGMRRLGAKLAYLIGYVALGWITLSSPPSWAPLLGTVVVWWLFAAIVVVTFPASAQLLREVVLVPLGYLVIIGAWLALVVLRESSAGAWVILWVMCVVWSADIGAYFAGRRFGQRKLAVLVSPGKTWEGAAGGVLLSIVIGTALGVGISPLAQTAEPLAWAVAAFGIAIVSIFGDLFESALKRARGVKDSGTFFPGHGGMLDRIDSLIAALPCAAFAVAHYG